MQRDDGESDDRVRLDKWLWAARFFKTRSLAADAIEGGKVDVNGDGAKRSKLVHAGDEIRVRHPPFEHVVRVLGVAERRGSASVAATLYEETAESRERRVKVALEMRQMNASFETGRPTKRERRDIDRFRGRE